MEQMQSKSWLIFVIIVIIVLALVSWYMTSEQNQSYRSVRSTETEEKTAAYSETDSKAPINNTQGEIAQISTIKSMHTITIETNKGTIVIETFDADAPKTVNNFITLANKGYYNGLIFHRVIEGFMIQGGDPTGTGVGGPGYEFADEINPSTPSYNLGYSRGIVAMANRGPNTNGSQFFIMHKDYPLPHNYTIFGRVISGMEAVDAIATTPKDENDKPKTSMTMKTVTVQTK